MSIKPSLSVSLFFLLNCTINAQELQLHTSRTTGTAPLYVFFDATSSSGLTEENDLVNSDFSWNFDMDNTDENGRWENTKGMVAGHVFELPGTYTVQCTLTTPNGTVVIETTTITVSSFSGITHYVSTSGNDTNDGLSESTPWQTANYALSQLAPNGRILFKRGDSFSNVDYNLQNLSGGSKLVGAYGTGELPILSGALGGRLELDFIDDLVFSDLHFIMTGEGVANFSIENCENILLLNLELEGASALATYFDECNQMAVFDTYIHDFGVLAIFSGEGTRLSWVGNTVNNLIGTAQAEHGVRIQGGEKQFIAHNTLSNLIDTKSAIQIRGDGQKHVMLYKNKMDRLLGVNPKNAATISAISQIVIEANYIGQNPDYTGSLRENSLNGINIEATNVSVRNNVIDGYRNAINVSHDYNGVVSGWVDAYHNTVNWRPVSPQSGVGGRIVNVRDVSHVNSINNLITAPSTMEAMVIGNSGENTNIVEDHNVVATPAICETQALPDSPAHLNGLLNFTLANSNEVNIIGVTGIPVFYDALNNKRNMTEPTIGAIENQTNLDDEDIDFGTVDDEITTPKWSLFYNPTQKTVYIQHPLGSEIITINVFSLNGQLIVSQQMTSVDNELLALNVSQLSTGYYTITLKSINDSHYQGFIKFE